MHQESSIKIFYTKDYSLFSNIQGNRTLNQPKIDRIVNEIDNGCDLLRYCPILVVEKDNKLLIIDGQHRLAVAKEVNSKIWYILAEELTLYEIAKMNTNTEKWNSKDFVLCYKQLGNENYKILNDFILKYNVPVTTALYLLGEGKVAKCGNPKNDFQQGKFEVKYLEFATAFMDIISEFTFYKKNSRSFLSAIEKIYHSKKIDIKELIEKVNKDTSALNYLESEKEYLTGLESVFNKGKHTREIIY